MTKRKAEEDLKVSRWSYPEEKVGKGFQMPEYKNLKLFCYIPNADTFKTAQVQITGWVSMNREYEQQDIEKGLFHIKFLTKQLIRNWKQKYFRNECIVDIDTRTLPTKNNWQFFSVEITHFIMPRMIFDKHTLLYMLQPFYENLIDTIFIDGNELFQITRSDVMDARKDKSMITRNARKQNQGI